MGDSFWMVYGGRRPGLVKRERNCCRTQTAAVGHTKYKPKHDHESKKRYGGSKWSSLSQCLSP